MNPKLIPILQRIIARDSVLRAFQPDNLPQSAQVYLWKSYAFPGGGLVAEDDRRELQSYLTLGCGDVQIREYLRAAPPSPDSSSYALYADGSLLIVTNAFQQVWADARDFVVECILPQMRLSLMDAELLRAIDSDHIVESIRDDFFHAFARVLNTRCGIPHCDARGHWNAYARQLSATEAERCELGGFESGAREGMLFAETFKYETFNA